MCMFYQIIVTKRHRIASGCSGDLKVSTPHTARVSLPHSEECISLARLFLPSRPSRPLAATIQAQILSLLLSLRESRDLTIVIVTHDLGVVAALCDRVVVMKDGRVVETGPVNDVFAAPQNDYPKTLLAAIPRAPGLDASGVSGSSDSSDVTAAEVRDV